MLIPLDGLSTDRGLKQLHENLNILLERFPADCIYDGNKSLKELLEEFEKTLKDEESEITDIGISDTELILNYSDGKSEKMSLLRDNRKRVVSIAGENGQNIKITYK